MRSPRWVSLVRALALATVLSTPAMQAAMAQEVEVAESEDPPDRVARLSLRQGDVTLEEAGSSERSTALLNRPLVSGDRLWAERDARAELQLGSATLHLDEYTGIELQDLGSDTLRLRLTEGALIVHVRDVDRTEIIEIETPNAVVSLLEPGEYALNVNRGGDTTVVKVRDGAAKVDSGESGARTYHVDAGRQGFFINNGGLSGAIDEIDRRTAFEQWSEDREQRASRSPSSRYVSREVIGYEDLDEYGDWRTDPGYGAVWYPRRVASSWAPYRFGHWAWVRPWGWTWIDDSPWGFAPFHYGRWAYLDSRWGWIPGPRYVRPVYAPALVAWVGGPSVSVSLSFGSGVGWFPLGPREVYVPGYRASRRHIHNVNVSNTTIVNNTYITNVYNTRGRNERYVHGGRRDAVTVVSQEDFTRGRPVDRHLVRVDDSERGRLEVNNQPPAWTGGGPDIQPGIQRNTQRGRGNIPRNYPTGGSVARGADSEAFSGRSERAGRPNMDRPTVSSDKQYRTRPESQPVPESGLSRGKSYRQSNAPERQAPARETYRAEPPAAISLESNPGRLARDPYREQPGRTLEPSRAPQRAAPAPQSGKQMEYRGGGSNEGGDGSGGLRRGGTASDKGQQGSQFGRGR